MVIKSSNIVTLKVTFETFICFRCSLAICVLSEWGFSFVSKSWQFLKKFGTIVYLCEQLL